MDMEMEVMRKVETKQKQVAEPTIKEEQVYYNMEDQVKGNEMLLKVYVSEENEKFYIDIFAAYSLGFVDYEEASHSSDSGKELYEISAETLTKLEQMFKNRIFYVMLDEKKLQDRENNFIEDRQDAEMEAMFEDNSSLVNIGDDIKMAYDNYKDENSSESFEQYLNNNGYNSFNENNQHIL